MSTIILLACCALSGVLGHLRASVRAAATLDRTRARLSAALAEADQAAARADRLEYERLTDVDRIPWGTPAVEAGLDRLLAEIRATEIEARVAEANQRARLAHPSTLPPLPPLPEIVIDLREPKDGAR